MDKSTPTVVKSHDINIDKEYIGWVEELKSRYRRAQIKAAVKVNAEQLLFNWQLGRDLVIRKAEEKWGSGVVEQVSMDLQAAFPESKGFSTTNLWRMKQWYQFYSDALKKLPQLVGELQLSESQLNTKLARLVGEFEDTDFPPLLACVPWGHHSEIIAKCKTIKEAIFYVKKSATEGWSRNTLMNCIKTRKATHALPTRTRNRIRIYGQTKATNHRRQDPQTGYAVFPHPSQLLHRH